MIQIPDNFPSYTSYNAKSLLQHVDTLKAAVKELQAEINALKNPPQPKTKQPKEPANG